MAVKISDIPQEGLAIELDQEIKLFDQEAATPVTALLSIKPLKNGIFRITGHAKAAPLLQCSRCLKRFTYPVDTELNFELAPLTSVGTTAERELVQGELDTEFYEGDAIEPADLVREHVLIALPMVALHHQDCRGLCSTCGIDLNEAECGCKPNQQESPGAFSALKDLLKK